MTPIDKYLATVKAREEAVMFWAGENADELSTMRQIIEVAIRCLEHYDNPHADDRGAPANEALTEIIRLASSACDGEKTEGR